MTSAIGAGAGIFLVILSLILWVTALPSVENNMQTDTGKPLENLSVTSKTIVNSYSIMFSLVPVILFSMGLLLAWKG